MKLTNFTICGNCSNCGECCSDLLHLDNEEISKIDNYLKEHKVTQFNKEPNNLNCPFRDSFLHRCEIYPARPYICRVFKCDIPVEQATINRDEINKGKKPRSMALLFFGDNSKQKYIKDNLGIKVYGRK